MSVYDARKEIVMTPIQTLQSSGIYNVAKGVVSPEDFEGRIGPIESTILNAIGSTGYGFDKDKFSGILDLSSEALSENPYSSSYGSQIAQKVGGAPAYDEMTPGMQAAADKGMDARMGRTYAENIQAMADQRMLQAKGGRIGYASGTKKKKKEEAIIDPIYIPSTLEEILNAIDIKPRASGSFTEGQPYGPDTREKTWSDVIGGEATVDLPGGFTLKGDYDKYRIKDRLYSPDDEYLDERVRDDHDRWKLELLWRKKFGGPKKLNQGGRASYTKGGLAKILGV